MVSFHQEVLHHHFVEHLKKKQISNRKLKSSLQNTSSSKCSRMPPHTAELPSWPRMWLMLWAGRLGCLPESAAEVLERDSRGDIGMAEPSVGMPVAISGNSEVRLKLDMWGVIPDELAMGMGGMSGSKGKLGWPKPTGRGGERIEPKRLLSGGALPLSALGLVNIWLDKYWRVTSLGRLG